MTTPTKARPRSRADKPAGAGAVAIETATQNPTTATAAFGILLSGIGTMFGWAAETQAAIAQIALGTAVLIRLVMLAVKDARSNLEEP